MGLENNLQKQSHSKNSRELLCSTFVRLELYWIIFGFIFSSHSVAF